MAHIKVNNANLYYEDEGQGEETIVFGHSMLFNLRMFDDQVEALKSSHRCVRFDFRGQGKSEVTAGGYHLDNNQGCCRIHRATGL
jgi:3-oxoadipate enol-lactonase